MGGRFCSLDQLRNSVSEIQLRPPKKRSPPKIEVFFAEIRWRPKKKGLRLRLKCFSIWITFPEEFGAMFDRNLQVFFLWSSSAQISMGGHLNVDGDTLTLDWGTRPPYNLSTTCAPHKRETCLPKRGLCPKESNRLGVTRVQFGVWVPLNTDHQYKIRGQEPLFRRFRDEDFTPEFVEFCAYFAKKTFFGLRARIWGKNLIVPPKLFMPPPQSRYSFAGPE